MLPMEREVFSTNPLPVNSYVQLLTARCFVYFERIF